MQVLANIFLPIVIVLLSSNPLYASSNALLQCLAKEETQIHKEKVQGTLYRLNQDLINELASTNDITLKKTLVEEICNAKQHSPTIGLLRLLLIRESEIYDQTFTGIDPKMRPYKMAYIDEFQKQVPKIFIQFISGLQSEMPTSDCLQKAIPEITIFNDHLKYLEEEMSTHELIKDKNNIEKIFLKLTKLKDIKENCKKRAALGLKRQMKKK